MSCTRTFVAALFTAAVAIASIPALAAEPPKPQSAGDKASQPKEVVPAPYLVAPSCSGGGCELHIYNYLPGWLAPLVGIRKA